MNTANDAETELIDFFKDCHKFEFDERDRTNSKVSIFFVAFSINFTTLLFIIRFMDLSNPILLWLTLFIIAVDIVFVFFFMHYALKAFQGKFTHLPSLHKMINEMEPALIHNEEVLRLRAQNHSEEGEIRSIKNSLCEFSLKAYSQCATGNRKVNNLKKDSLIKALKALWASIFCLVGVLVIFLVSKFPQKHKPDAVSKFSSLASPGDLTLRMTALDLETTRLTLIKNMSDLLDSAREERDNGTK